VTLNGATTAHNHNTHGLIGILTDAGVRTITNNSGA
jgi:predicted metal-dependent enzyme (double-stranded beta helix superfamily)